MWSIKLLPSIKMQSLDKLVAGISCSKEHLFAVGFITVPMLLTLWVNLLGCLPWLRDKFQDRYALLLNYDVIVNLHSSCCRNKSSDYNCNVLFFFKHLVHVSRSETSTNIIMLSHASGITGKYRSGLKSAGCVRGGEPIIALTLKPAPQRDKQRSFSTCIVMNRPPPPPTR